MMRMVVPSYRAWEEQWNERRMTEDDPWQETSGGGGRWEVMGSPSGERLMWKGTGRVAGNEQMLRRRESHADQGGEVNG